MKWNELRMKNKDKQKNSKFREKEEAKEEDDKRRRDEKKGTAGLSKLVITD